MREKELDNYTKKAMNGRTYSHDPDFGVPLALNNLNDETITDLDKNSCLCYLGYRILDGYRIDNFKHISANYTNTEFIIEEIDRCINKIASTSMFDKSIYVRWFLSLSILNIYLKYIIQDKRLPMKDLMLFNDIKYIKVFPQCFVNIIRICAMAYVTKTTKNNRDHEKLRLMLDKMSHYYITSVKIRSKDHLKNFTHECAEAIRAIQSVDHYLENEKETINNWKNCSCNPSEKFFYRCLLIIIGRRDLIIPG